MVIFKFKKVGDAKFYSHLDMMRLFILAIRRAGICVNTNKRGEPKIYFSPATPIGVESLAEFVEIDTDLSAHKMAELLKTYLPDGIEIMEEYDTKARMRISAIAKLSKYEIDIDGLVGIQKRVSELLSSSEFFIKLKMNNRLSTETVNTLIHSFSFDKGKLVVYGFTGENNLSITQTILQLLKLTTNIAADFKITKTTLYARLDDRYHDIDLLLLRNKI